MFPTRWPWKASSWRIPIALAFAVKESSIVDTRVISSVDGAQVFTSSAKGAAYEKVSTCALRPGGNGIASRAEARRLNTDNVPPVCSAVQTGMSSGPVAAAWRLPQRSRICSERGIAWIRGWKAAFTGESQLTSRAEFTPEAPPPSSTAIGRRRRVVRVPDVVSVAPERSTCRLPRALAFGVEVCPREAAEHVAQVGHAELRGRVVREPMRRDWLATAACALLHRPA